MDSSGNEIVNSEDCTFGLIGQTVDVGLEDGTDGADVLANDLAMTNPCGFGVLGGPDPDFNGLVDLNSDITITAADSCDDCFFGLDLDNGFVVESGVGTAETLDLTPAADSNPEDTPHTVNALVEDSNGDPVAGVTVEFTVTGVNPTTDRCGHERERRRIVHLHRSERRWRHHHGVRRQRRRREQRRRRAGGHRHEDVDGGAADPDVPRVRR